MARWYAFLGANRARMQTPDLPDRAAAEVWVRDTFGPSLTFTVQSAASYEVSVEDLAAYQRNTRLKVRDSEADAAEEDAEEAA